MDEQSRSLGGKVALITGGAQRIGAQIARTLHRSGMDLILHFRSSSAAAADLRKELEASRPDSVHLVQADLQDWAAVPVLLEQIRAFRNRLDVLVNNASAFYATPLDQVEEAQWEALLGTNLKAPFFLSCAVAPWLRTSRGSILNLVDIHGERPLKNYPIYSIAKAGNAMMVKSLARELGPEVRVNGIAPGAILWPEEALDAAAQERILDRTALKRAGSPQDIARTLLFLVRDAPYITGQIIAVDGGRSLQQ